MKLISKEQFLEEHNKLSPKHLQATLTMLDHFREEKKPLTKDNGWCLDKMRIPFISWLITEKEVPKKESQKKGGPKNDSRIYKIYPGRNLES